MYEATTMSKDEGTAFTRPIILFKHDLVSSQMMING